MRKFKVAVVMVLSMLILPACSAIQTGLMEQSTDDTTAMEVSTEKRVEYSDFYYDQLTETEQTIYQQMLSGCENFESKIALSSCTKEELRKAELILSYEHPEFFWISEYTYEYVDDTVLAVSFTVPENAEETQNSLNEIGDSIISQLSGTDYEKVKAIYEYIINETDYKTDSENNQDIRSVLISHASVCAGYAKTFEFLCQKADIPCVYVSGRANETDHAWNMVYIDGNYYWVDVTWGDPVYLDEPERSKINYDYLCVSDENFTEHTADTTYFSYPECLDDSLNYYRLQGMYFENYDREEIGEYLSEKVDSGQTDDIEMKFGSTEAYQEAVNDLITEQNIYDMVNDTLGYQRIRCSYVGDEDAAYLSVSFSDAG